MNRRLFGLIVFSFILFSCGSNNHGNNALAAKVDSLSEQLRIIKEKYKPGLGEVMSGVQMHHAKLWYAAINNNWSLSQYETDELNELLHFARDVETERPEIKKLPMIFPPLDSVDAAVHEKNLSKFKTAFDHLTATCNSCHRENHFDFNVITVPSAPPVSNQDFRAH